MSAGFNHHMISSHHQRPVPPLGRLGRLLLKLAEDGAQIRLLREENTGYRDRELYEVTLRP